MRARSSWWVWARKWDSRSWLASVHTSWAVQLRKDFMLLPALKIEGRVTQRGSAKSTQTYDQNIIKAVDKSIKRSK